MQSNFSNTVCGYICSYCLEMFCAYLLHLNLNISILWIDVSKLLLTIAYTIILVYCIQKFIS